MSEKIQYQHERWKEYCFEFTIEAWKYNSGKEAEGPLNYFFTLYNAHPSKVLTINLVVRM